MYLESLDCPNCGARLPEPEASGTVICRYCEQTFQAHPPPAPAPAPALEPPVQEVVARLASLHNSTISEERSSAARSIARSIADVVKAIRSLMMAAVILVLLAGAVAVSLLHQGGANRTTSAKAISALSPIASVLSTVKNIAEQLPVAKAGERALWDFVGGPPRYVEMAGSELVVGRMRLGNADELFIVAAAPDTRQIRWRAGPFGTYRDGSRSTLFAPSGNRIIISDYRAILHVVDAGTGKELATARMTDRAERLCALPNGEVFIAQVDKHDGLLDPKSGKLRGTAGAPKGCGDGDVGPAALAALARSVGPKIPGMSLTRARVDGDMGVAAGVKSPGTALPMVAGFHPKAAAVTWQQPLAAVDPTAVRDASNEYDDLVGGRYIASYGVGPKSWHVTALDARTGRRLWDTTLKEIFAVDSLSGVVASKRYVYVVRSESLDILDATNGKWLGALGNETYAK